MGMVGADRSVLGAVCQAAVASPVTSFHVVNRTAISQQYRREMNTRFTTWNEVVALRPAA